MINSKSAACGCLGPMYNEPFCPCRMVRENIPRSKEHDEYFSEENVKLRREEFKNAMFELNKWKKNDNT